MNTKIFAFLILVLSSCSNREYKSILWPTVNADKKIYFDQCETTVEVWLSYYTWKLENEGYASAIKVLPDSNALEPGVWKFINSKSTIYSNRYGGATMQPLGYFHEKCNGFIKYDGILDTFGVSDGSCPFLDFPITGITYEQAVDFCKWRTQIRGEDKVEFRLPTENEWKTFAQKDLNEEEQKNGHRDTLYSNSCPMFNYNFKKTCAQFEKTNYTQSRQIGIARFMKEKNKAFDVFGNVSEMTATKGVAKGGNFRTFAKDCHVNAVQNYTNPEVWLGFRCIAIIKE